MTDAPRSLFDRISWRDPVSGVPLEPIILARTPAGVPVCGALRVAGTKTGYPIVDSVARLTPELAAVHRVWLELTDLLPVEHPEGTEGRQAQATVESFGFQWSWNANPRTEQDLRHRVAEKFGAHPDDFAGHTVLDAGAGAGDQSRYMLEHGASVLSVDLSGAIDVVSRKLRMHQNWFGVQGDIAHLPVADEQFDIVYCEGVIQHTADSFATVAELKRVLKVGGRINATHYVHLPPRTFTERVRRTFSLKLYGFFRRRFASMDPYKLLSITGVLAALNNVPLMGAILRRLSLSLVNPLMPEFRSTWTNTYDFWGSHEHQRFVTPDEFWAYFDRAGGMQPLRRNHGVIVATRVA